MNDDQIWENFQFEEPSNRFLTLPTSIMEHICRLLVDRKDKYETCLIHPNWSIAAVNVLWEAPRFQRPQQLRAFVDTIRTSRKTALLVRDLYLAFLDAKEETVFKTIVRSTIERHSYENAKVLANPKFLLLLAKSCENITDFTCYGWQLERADWEHLAFAAPQLSRLHIIGGYPHQQLNINNLLSRLTSLHLDGFFNIDEAWATNLVNKAIHLTDLQISLEKLQYSVLERICTPDHLKLEKLTLTGTSEIKDVHISRVLQAFPYLTKFCLEGCTKISAQTILISLTSCPYLQHLEIRANPTIFEKSPIVYLDKQQPAWTPKLAKLLIENMNITDDNLQAISPLLPHLQVLGLKNCPRLTNQGLEFIVSNPYIKHLSQLLLIHCPNIHSSLFAVDTLTITKSITEIHMDSCGPISPVDIYKLCCRCINHRLRSIKLINYQDLKGSIIDTYNDDQSVPSSTLPFRIILNRANIDALAHSDDPQLCPIPNDRLLTGYQIVLLAKRLDVTTQELLALFDHVEQEEQAEINKKSQQSIMPTKLPIKNNLNRLESLKTFAAPRPTTPAIWSKDFNDNGGIPTINDDYSSAINESPQSSSDTDNYREEEEEEDYEEVDNNEVNNESKISWAEYNQVENSHTNLGGWGIGGSSNNAWNKASANESTIQPENQKETWLESKGINPDELWQQQALESNKKLFKTSSKNHFRNSPMIVEGDGWGEPEKVIDWDDLRTQGFAYDVLVEQKETTFWKKVNGIWTECQTNSTEQVVAESSDKPAPSLFSDISDKEQSDKRNLPSSMSVVSSDESSSWNNDEDDNIIVKVNPDSPTYTYRAPLGTNDRKNRKEQPLSPVKQNNINGNKPNALDNDVSKPVTGWQDPLEASSKNARDQWASIAKSNPVARNNSKRSTRNRGRTPIPSEQMSPRWKEFTAENSETLVTLDNTDFNHSDQQSQQKKQQQMTQQQRQIESRQSKSTPSSSSVDLLVDLDDNKESLWGFAPLTSSFRPTNDILVPEQPSNQKKRESQTAMETLFWTAEEPAKETKEEAGEQTIPDVHFAKLIPGTADEYSQDNSGDNLFSLHDVLVPRPTDEKMTTKAAESPIPVPSSLDELVNRFPSPSEALIDPLIPQNKSPQPPLSGSHHRVSSASEIVHNPTPSRNETAAAKSVSENRSPTKVSSDDPEEEVKRYKKYPNYLGSLKVYVSKNVYKYLIMFLDEEVEESVRKFCEKYNVQPNAANLLEQAKPLYVRRRTKKILKRRKNGKATTPTASDMMESHGDPEIIN
ncbi:hypothetical protein G6F52_008922 [Rhizopus delemar]|nr:hypothetical protein G6F52_008922 [Rhizopus delemar]